MTSNDNLKIIGYWGIYILCYVMYDMYSSRETCGVSVLSKRRWCYLNQKLKEKTKESLFAVLPITIIVLIISFILVPMDIGTIALFFVGALMLIVGMGFFQLGAETSMIPLGEGVGVQITKSKRIVVIALITIVIGVIITIAEPDLQVLASIVPSISSTTLIWTVAAGVGVFLAVAILRILLKVSLSMILIVFYTALFIISFFAPQSFLSIAFDSGGVTTGPITVPFILAMGVGFASIRSDKNATDDSFGLVALSSIGPILMVMLLGIFFNQQGASHNPVEITNIVTTRDILRVFAQSLPHYAWDVFVSIIPIIAVFLILQLTTRRYHRKQRIRVIVGFIYTTIGLILFLTGVGVGFAPVGSLLGSEISQSMFKWLLIPIGMLIGYYIVKAEPAIHILNHQVENVTNGLITAKTMNFCLSLGVAVSVGLAMLRSITGISIYWIIIPGYVIALVLSRIVPKIFVGIAFDSGGVASGPMTSTFLLPLCIGVSEALGGDVMTNAFGVVALVAMTPLVAIQIMGLMYKIKSKKIEELPEIPVKAADEILDFEE